MSTSDHIFGNQATDLKLGVISDYLGMYTTALRPRFKRLWYIDAFAGTGYRTVSRQFSDGLLLGQTQQDFKEQRRGSALIALETKPKFDRFTFIEKKPSHVAALEQLRRDFADQPIDVVRGDCNEVIPRELLKQNWAGTRAVMFLDPYGLTVDWTTLETIRRTGAIDVWYLVNINGILRQAARSGVAVDDHKHRRLTRMFGTGAWRTAWYDFRRKEHDLLGEADLFGHRVADEAAVEAWVKSRLEDLFTWVPQPLRLYMDRGRVHQFSLFFALSNASGPAIGLAKRLAGHVLSAGNSSQVRPR